MKVFYALTFDTDEKDKLSKMSFLPINMCEGGKFTESYNYHMTLTFVGNINDNDLDKYIEILKGINLVANEIEISGFDYFKKKRIILYFKVTSDKKVDCLKGLIDDQLSLLDFKDQYDVFVPHITIGRNIKKLKDNDNEEFEKVTIKVKSIALMESRNDGSGVVYKEIFEKRTI